jgi:hypothetical protein
MKIARCFLVASFGLLFGMGLVRAENSGGPGPDFQLSTDDPPLVSPDGTILVEQYFKPGDGYVFQFWTFDREHKHPALLNPGETDATAGYSAGFRFSPDGHWLVRMQKIAAGESTLFLYRREGDHFVSATDHPLGDLAWDYFFSRPESHGIDRSNLSPETILVKGMDNNYASLGEHWPDSRYIVIDLSSGESGTAVLGPWRCVYDTKTGHFSVPDDFARFNQHAADGGKDSK